MTLHAAYAIAGSIVGAITLTALAYLLFREVRTAPVYDATEKPTTPPAPTTYTVTATLGKYSVEVTSRQPITIRDLEASRVLLVRRYGPVWGTALAFELFEQVIATESENLDDELQNLTGGAA